MQSFDQPINDGELVEKIRSELAEIDSMAINDHSQRFEELHQWLTGAISSIDGV